MHGGHSGLGCLAGRFWEASRCVPSGLLPGFGEAIHSAIRRLRHGIVEQPCRGLIATSSIRCPSACAHAGGEACLPDQFRALHKSSMFWSGLQVVPLSASYSGELHKLLKNMGDS